MINYKDAKNRVQVFLDKKLEQDDEIVYEIIESETIEKTFGWVFFYNSKEYLATSNMSAYLAGNAPIIINRMSETIIETGTAYPIEYYLEKYNRGEI